MGYLSAYDTLAEVGDLEQALSIHFSSNCYPPVPQYMVAVAVQALDYVLEGEHSYPIALPEGVLWRGDKSVRAINVIESLHLEAFLDGLTEGEDSDESY